jgi:predicted secreted protein
MSVQGWVGSTLRIAIDGVIIAAVRTKSVAFGGAAIDITEGEQDGYRRLLGERDERPITVSVEGVATVNNYQRLLTEWYGETLTTVSVLHPDGSSTASPDGAFLNALSHGAEHNGAVSFQAQFTMSGTLAAVPFVPSPPVLTARNVAC